MKTMKKLVSMVLAIMMIATVVVIPTVSAATSLALPINEDFDGETVDTLKAAGFAFEEEDQFSVVDGELVEAKNYKVPLVSFNLDNAVANKVLNLQVKWETIKYSNEKNTQFAIFADDDDWSGASNANYLAFVSETGVAAINSDQNGSTQWANYTYGGDVTPAPDNEKFSGEWTADAVIDLVNGTYEVKITTPSGHYAIVKPNGNAPFTLNSIKSIGMEFSKREAHIKSIKAWIDTNAVTLPMDENFDGKTVDTLKTAGFGFEPESYFSVNADGDLDIPRDKTTYTDQPVISFNLDNAVANKVMKLQVKWESKSAKDNDTKNTQFAIFADDADWDGVANAKYLAFVSETGVAAINSAQSGSTLWANYTYGGTESPAPANSRFGEWTADATIDLVNGTYEVKFTSPSGYYAVVTPNSSNPMNLTSIKSIGLEFAKRDASVKSIKAWVEEPGTEPDEPGEPDEPVIPDEPVETEAFIDDNFEGYSATDGENAIVELEKNGIMRFSQAQLTPDNAPEGSDVKDAVTFVKDDNNTSIKITPKRVDNGTVKSKSAGVRVDTPQTSIPQDSTVKYSYKIKFDEKVDDMGYVEGLNYAQNKNLLLTRFVKGQIHIGGAYQKKVLCDITLGQWQTIEIVADYKAHTIDAKVINADGTVVANEIDYPMVDGWLENPQVYTDSGVGYVRYVASTLCSAMYLDDLYISTMVKVPALSNNRVSVIGFDGAVVENKTTNVPRDISKIELNLGTEVTAGEGAVTLEYLDGATSVAETGFTAGIVDGRTYTLTFNKMLKSGKTYTLKVPANAFKNSNNENLASAYELEFTVETKADLVDASIVGFTDGTNALTTLDEFKAATVRKAVYNYKNYSANPENSILLIAYYKGDALADAEFFRGTGNIPAEKADVVIETLTKAVPEGTTAVKMFLWDDLVEMAPYSSSYGIPNID